MIVSSASDDDEVESSSSASAYDPDDDGTDDSDNSSDCVEVSEKGDGTIRSKFPVMAKIKEELSLSQGSMVRFY